MDKGWDEAARQGAQAAGRMKVNLTDRTDLKSGKAGWEDAVKGTAKRVRAKIGSSM